MRSVDPYTALAQGYDEVMAHVNYDEWARYICLLVDTHHIRTNKVLEVACGTGALAAHLSTLTGAETYNGVDVSTDMIEIARNKNLGQSVRFDAADCRRPIPVHACDLVLMLYDSVNYLLTIEDVESAFSNIRECVAEGGYFIFDTSTSYNSIANASYFEDRGKTTTFSFVRTSSYDTETALHQTTFEITTDDGTFCETHMQRAYDRAEIKLALERTGWALDGTYSGMTLEPVGSETERIHWIARRRGGS